MAASVYATPPPDLSGEEAALSDASNSSQTNSSQGSTLKASKRTLSSSFLNVATTTTNTQSSTPTNASQLSSDSLPDLSKKRRKQSMPIRFSANGTAIEGLPTGAEAGEDNDGGAPSDEGRPSNPPSPTTEADNENDERTAAAAAAAAALLLEEQQNNFQKIFLSNLSQLQQKHLQLQHSDGFLPLGNPESFLSSKLNSLIAFGGSRTESDDAEATGPGDDNGGEDERPSRSGGKDDGNNGSANRGQTPDGSSKENGKGDAEEGDGEMRPHRFDHNEEVDVVMKSSDENDDQQGQERQHQEPTLPGLSESSGQSHPKITMKKELFMDPEWDGEIRSGSGSSMPKPDDWISIAGLSFPFPPEAAAALSAGGYLPQLPQLLGVPGVSGGFGSSTEAGNRTGVPPLRIFNPEAYCDLCNKEFCNKYFLKTHKANKHGIYEPAASSSSSSSAGNNNVSSDNNNSSASALSAMGNPFNSIHQLSQVFQMQHQQQQQQQHQQQLPSSAEQLDKLSTGQAGEPNPSLILPSQHHQQQSSSGASGQPQGSAGGSTKQSTQQGGSSSRSTQSPKGTPAGHIQPTVFCDICFKKFRSLSAMRKHRSKAHELSGGSGGGSQQLQQQLHQQQQQQQLQQHQLQQQLQQHLHQQYQQQMQQHQQLLDTKPESNEMDMPPLQLPDGFREDYTIEQEDVSFTPQPRKLSPHSVQAARDANFSADKLRRLGVVNPEAFCLICCKEYCNKYFLRTHRLKRHGILPTPDELKDERGQQPWSSFMQTAPLNLIMGGTAAELVNAQMALQASSPSPLKKFLAAAAAAGELAGESGSGLIEGAKGSAVEIKEEQQSFGQSKSGRDRHLNGGDAGGRTMDSMGDSDEQAHQSDGGNAADSGEERQGNRDAGSDEDAEAISVDLQKLQSMIMQLNDLNSMQQQQHQNRKMGCGICNKEMANQYLLHAHMLQEHGSLAADNNNGPGPKNGSSREATPLVEPTEVCKQCDKEFPNVFLLKQHLVEVHCGGGLSDSIPSPKREGFVTPERPTQSGAIPMPPAGGPYVDRKPFSMTPTSSYCEICNKELCNKYFMKTHMQRMHGIEIENGAQIGGVVCNICNKELCSKYFLRVHKHNTHGIVEEGSPLPQPRQNGSGGGGAASGGGAGGGGGGGTSGGGGGGGAGGGVGGSGSGSNSGASSDPGVGESGEGTPGGLAYPTMSGGESGGTAALKPGEISDLSNRYYSHFTEVCSLCSRRFRSAKWLRAHLLSDHGKSGVEKLKDLEQKLTTTRGSGLGGGGNGRVKSNSPSLKVPNGLSDGAGSKYGPKSPFAPGLSPVEAAKFLPKGVGLFGPEQPPSPMAGLKGYQCSYCSFATPLLPLLFIHERSHSSLTIVQQQLLQQQQQFKQEEAQAQSSILGSADGFAPLLKSESAVSLAKDQTAGQLMPGGTSSETPSSTPASTPVSSLSQDALHLLQSRQSTHSPVARPTSSSYEQSERSPQPPEESCSKPGTASSPKPASPASEPSSMLSELANLTQRPAVYALPQQPRGGPLMMQSFLIEECGGGRSPKDTDSDKESGGPENRFVPAVVFLPVKERILTPMTISFNLSPA